MKVKIPRSSPTSMMSSVESERLKKSFVKQWDIAVLIFVKK